MSVNKPFPWMLRGNFKLIIQGFIHHVNRYTPQKSNISIPKMTIFKAGSTFWVSSRLVFGGCHPSSQRFAGWLGPSRTPPRRKARPRLPRAPSSAAASEGSKERFWLSQIYGMKLVTSTIMTEFCVSTCM